MRGKRRGGVGQRRDGDAGAVVSWGARGKRDRVPGDLGWEQLPVEDDSDNMGPPVRGTRREKGGNRSGFEVGPSLLGQTGCSSPNPFLFFFLLSFILFCFLFFFITLTEIIQTRSNQFLKFSKIQKNNTKQ
jgi:hypothetical protein